MSLSRRLFVSSLFLLMASCAPGVRAPVDASGRALEPLTVVTATGRHDFMVEIADTDATRQQGLMFRPPLEDDRGMLFQFPVAEEQGFWMRNTPSSLDIVYIDPTGHIVSIASHTTPRSEAVIPSNGAANGVLEVRAGRMDEIGARAGDTIVHPFFAK